MISWCCFSSLELVVFVLVFVSVCCLFFPVTYNVTLKLLCWRWHCFRRDYFDFRTMNVTLFLPSVIGEGETHIDIQDFQSKNAGKMYGQEKTQNEKKTTTTVPVIKMWIVSSWKCHCCVNFGLTHRWHLNGWRHFQVISRKVSTMVEQNFHK